MAIGYRFGDLEEPLDPVDSDFGSSVDNKFCRCIPEGRLDVVEVGEKGESLRGDGSGRCRGGDFDRRWNWKGEYGS